MLWLVYSSSKCNLKCKYCGGSWPDLPPKPVYPVSTLKEYLEAVDPRPAIVFYGGEPLLNPKFIMDVMDNVEATFGIQTNATLHHLLPPRYWERMKNVLISIDGPEEFNDSRRGRGSYAKALELAYKARRLGVKRVIARMAVDLESDIYRDVKHLLSLPFTHVHWQLSVDWVPKWDLRGWAERSYLPGIRRLAEEFKEHYLRTGELLGIVPFIALLKAHKEPWDWVPCGAGRKAYSVLTDGSVVACPIAPYEGWAKAGSVYERSPPKALSYPEGVPCERCEYKGYCGGRCLYWLYERFWGDEGMKEICWVTKKYIDTFFEVVGDLADEMAEHEEVASYDPLEDSTEAVP
ncbi:TIGR04084 family radical SAM/SPASM domain-containing protein [Ignicoccus hospitalis]|uniref:Radical SAM domain protein n=1 Tax=Ignicoccus hospitalis (strain KIN4/I / DSM 18386 / JCM 14125) TaxID=453591 RepID=A8A9B3_IGNH4|nr:TIGR04084 family radical SAM/SPASM domain-containing protein [Ignicoccus hospitalis]ABU81515.1 Radical SAM domain protein [Ignicoccus hospitalis KIN4/I]HIH90450.1 TIGR04084 family radical SAM/SPASM domain-containing protein [Desulfurococcaceae archaeon]